MFYVLGEHKLSDMPQPKYSYQRNTCRGALYYTNERKECLMTQIQKKVMSVPTDIAIISYTVSFVSAFFENS